MSPRGKPIRIVVVDDHDLLLQSLWRVLDAQPDMSVAATGGTVDEAVRAVDDVHPDIVLMDYQLPDGDGATAAKRIMAGDPGVRVIMLSGTDNDSALFGAASAGCAGFFPKTEAPAELVRIIRSVHDGHVELPIADLDRHPPVGQLVVHYQPIVDLTTEAVVGFEALVRRAHPTRGLILPAEFIGLAEQTAYIVEIGAHVRPVAMRQATEWNRGSDPHHDWFMSVNVSGRELVQNGLPRQIANELEQAGLEPSNLVIELTETFFVGDTKENIARLRHWHELGIRIALDDFGTGYSSLAYLRQFPIDIIKLDKSFTDDLPGGERGLRLMEAVGRLATEMGAVTEAEGIETAAQAALLRSAGWQLGQGFHYCPPGSASEITKVLAGSR